MRCMLKKFRSCISPGVEQLCLLAKLWYSIVWDKQETQLSQRDRAMLLVIECFVKSLKFTHGHSKRHCWLGHVPISISLKLCLYVYHFWDIQASASKMAWFWNRGRVRSKSLKMAPFDRSHDFLLVRKYSSILYRFWVIWRCRDLEMWVRAHSVIRNGTIRKLGCGFLFAFYSNYGSILHQFQDKARYWSQIVLLSYPRRAFGAPVRGPRRITAIPFGVEKLEW